MKVKDLIAQLQKSDPEADVITGFWNGHVSTYCMIDSAWEAEYGNIENDFFGTPGAVDLDVVCSKTKNVVYLGASFPDKDKRVFYARRVNWRMQNIIQAHRSVQWKKDRLYNEMKAFNEDYERDWWDRHYGVH